MKKNIIDRAVEFINPSAAVQRAEARRRMDSLEQRRRSFEAAKKSRYSRDVLALSTSVNQEVHSALVVLRNKARELERNNDYAKNIARIIPNNVVGTGILPNISVNGKHNSRSDKLKAIWKNWADELICDVAGRNTLYGLQHLAMRTTVISGECLIVRRRKSSQFDLPLQLQVLEGDYIDTTKYNPALPDGSAILYGIHLNTDGSRRGYYIYDKHPNEFASKSEFVSAEDVIHIYEMERPGQLRGVPFSRSSMIRTQDIDDYELAARVKAKMASSLMAFVTGDGSADEVVPDDFDEFVPGMVARLNVGESINIPNLPVDNNYGEFTRNNQRAVAAGNGVTYESMTNDYSQVNFSSGRMGWIEFSRNVQQWQWNVMVPHLCKGVFRWFVEACQLTGAAGFRDVVTADWTAPRREMIDPVKETNARIAAIDAGLTSRQEVMREDGYNPDDLYREIAEDAAIQQKFGLTLSQNQAVADSSDTDSNDPKVKI